MYEGEIPTIITHQEMTERPEGYLRDMLCNVSLRVFYLDWQILSMGKTFFKNCP